MALGGALTKLAEELTHQYRVTYARPQSLIPPEHVTVASGKPGLKARGTLINEPPRDAVTRTTMLRFEWLATAAAASTMLAVGAAQTPQTPSPAQPPDRQAPSFRVGVDLVSLNVTVTDGARYVTDLTADDFNVFEDGVKQDVTFFNRTNLPIALALLLDTSASMDTKLPTAQEAAIGFARRLRPQDLAEVIDFDSRVVMLQNFTSNAAELEQAIRKTSAGGSTSLYNAVYIALKDLKKVVAKHRGNPAPGDRRALGRRRHVEPPALRGGPRPREALRDRDLLDRPARARRPRHDDERLQGSGVRAAAVRAGNRRPLVLSEPAGGSGRRLRADLRRALEPVHGRVHVPEPQARRIVAASWSCGSTGPI